HHGTGVWRAEPGTLKCEHRGNPADPARARLEPGRDRGDPSALAPLFEDTLVYVDYDGSLMNKAEYLRSVANPVSKPDHIRDEGMKVHVYGSTGIVSGIYRETGKEKGKPYARRARFTDTWIKQSGQWKCVASQSTLIH